MTDEKVFTCKDCDDVLMCPYLSTFQCPKLTIERESVAVE